MNIQRTDLNIGKTFTCSGCGKLYRVIGGEFNVEQFHHKCSSCGSMNALNIDVQIVNTSQPLPFAKASSETGEAPVSQHKESDEYGSTTDFGITTSSDSTSYRYQEFELPWQQRNIPPKWAREAHKMGIDPINNPFEVEEEAPDKSEENFNDLF